MTAEAIAQALGGRRSGSQYVAPCPAHEDRNPSLSITERNGLPLVHCHAGCPQAKLIAALRTLGIWSEQTERPEHPPEWGRIVREYDYVDEHRQLLYQVCRFEPKSFRPRRPGGHGGWRWGYGDVRRVLYRLPEVLEAPIVFVVEGEKDVETLRSHGFAATTNAGGAKGWRDEFSEVFRGREVIIIPDNDAPGWERAKQIARGVLPYASAVRVLELGDTKDISDWFEAGHSEVELISALESVQCA